MDDLMWIILDNLYGWAMSQKMPVDGFWWVENTSQLSKEFIGNYNEDSDEGCFLEIDVQYPKTLRNLHNDFPFLTKRMKIERAEKLVANLHD